MQEARLCVVEKRRAPTKQTNILAHIYECGTEARRGRGRGELGLIFFLFLKTGKKNFDRFDDLLFIFDIT